MKKINDLDSHIGFWMRYVSNHVSASFEKKLIKWGVSVAEWVVLRNLYDDETLSPSVLAERIGMTRGAMSKLLNRLFSKHLIEREEAEKDRRFQEVHLTPKGKLLVPKLAAAADSNDEYFFGHLSKGQKNELLEILQQIVSQQALNEIPLS